ncbi:MAG: EAL domain-containing protein [Magnetococcales bacterium]|nr:EAL domain-containing protein [Magnetococcales bacterium]MBF0156798.1 EAL domain-containing protein [Magnetococcales bacterium]
MPETPDSGLPALSDLALDDFRRLLDSLPNGIVIHETERIVYANEATGKLIGALPQELIGAPVNSLFDPDSHGHFQAVAVDILKGDKEFGALEATLSCRDGRQAIVEAITGRLALKGTTVLFTTLHDISQRKRLDEAIRRQANYDTLTGLPNRTLFLERLKQELIRAERTRSRVALMFIDLDRFKWVNDTMGHAAGDQLLKEVAGRLSTCLRKSDTVARLGGDEFTAILPDMAKGPFAERVAGQILEQLATPFILEGQEAFISGSIGVTVFPDDAGDLAELLKNADSAMYRAKNDGRNAYRFFTPDMHAEALERMALEKDLHRAMDRGELIIHYQPIIDLKTRALVGAESFLRWHHSQRGWVSPELFVPLAEEIGLIAEITEWALHTACAQAEIWRQGPAPKDFFVTANLSCTRCRELSTDDKIPGILRKSGLPPTGLVLEITENILMEDEERAMSMLNHLRRLGVVLWLDDFGTGYSSLSILKRLPVNGIKIDRTFVPDVTTDPESRVLVEAIMSMAKSLGRQIIGEGVENRDQAEFLTERGCHMAQGYYFGRPCPADEFVHLFAQKG